MQALESSSSGSGHWLPVSLMGELWALAWPGATLAIVGIWGMNQQMCLPASPALSVLPPQLNKILK